MQFAIKASLLSKHFNNKSVVDSLNLEIEEGTIFGFLGQNGAGKTTTMKLLLGLLKPTGGNSAILGFDSWQDGDTLRKNVGVLFDEPGLYSWLNGPENIRIYGNFHHLHSPIIEERTKKLTDMLDISGDDLTQPVRKLSRGNRQKWGLCRALLTNPRVLFLDEPTVNLDPVTAHEVRKYIEKLSKEKNTTVFLNTHDLDEAILLCHKVGIIHQGKLVACDTPQNLHPEEAEYNIKYKGNKVEENELASLPGKITGCFTNHLRVAVNNNTEISFYVQYLVETKRQIYQVSLASNPLENILLGLIKESVIEKDIASPEEETK